jgi:hypothetical protein
MNRAAIVCLTLGLAATPALADTITHRLAKVTIDVPDTWKSATNGDVITLADQHENVAISFGVVDAGAVHHATKVAVSNLGEKIKHLNFKAEQAVSFNGLAGYAIEGDGTVDGKDISLMVAVLDTPSDDKDLLIVALGEDVKLVKHKDEVLYIFNHLRPKQ